MSTTFDVFPGSKIVPTCGEVLRLAERHLRARLAALGIDPPVELTADVHENDESWVTPLTDDAPFSCGEDSYIWIRLNNLVGGTDCYFTEHLEASDDLLADLQTKHLLPDDYLRACIKVGHHWSFRRSMGQPAVINLTYGLVAAALAECVGGFVYSEDAAWDFQRFPAKATQFLKWYFTPAAAIDPDLADWASRCNSAIPEELGIVVKSYPQVPNPPL